MTTPPGSRVDPEGPREPTAPPDPGAHLVAILIVAITTAAALAARHLLQVPDVEMLFLLAVMVVGLTSGRRASLLAAVLSVLAYDFFIVPPPYTLDVSDARYLLTFAMMLGLGVVIGTLTQRLREQEHAAVVREQRTSTLYALSRSLGGALDAAGVAAASVHAVAEGFRSDAAFLAARGREQLEQLAIVPAAAALDPGELAVARWVLEHGRPAGRGTDALADATVLCVPLRTWGDVLAVLAVRPPGDRRLSGEQRELLEALARQAALALDRVRLADEARRAELRAKAEELRSGLLSSVSHDLRTPLAAITGAGTLLLESDGAEPALRRELTVTVVEEAERLERLVANLLDMTRLESGVVEPKREWVPLDEVVGAALTRLEHQLAGRPVVTDLAADLPLLSIDPVLLEQLLVNLLENAVRYTPPATEIAIRAVRRDGEVRVEIADRGAGIPPGQEERVFERFHRVARPGVRGVGLGLAIARAIAQAHGGRLTAGSRPGGGAVFALTLPLLEPPASPPEPPDAPRPAAREEPP